MSNGEIKTGFWKDGEREGEFTVIRKDGKIEKVTYKRGEMIEQEAKKGQEWDAG